MRILVAGATGRFGSVCDMLIERGHAVRAGIRDPRSPAAARLRDVGAELVRADFDDPASLEAATGGVDAVFASGTAHRAGPDGEAQHGRNLAGALAAAGVPHLVFVSGDGAAPDSPLPLFRAKWQVEEAIRASRIPSTILAPTYLMENLFNPWNIAALQAGFLPSPIPVDHLLQQTAVADLLSLAVLAVERPDELVGRRVAVASDELTAERAAAAISELIPRTVEARRAPAEALPPGSASCSPGSRGRDTTSTSLGSGTTSPRSAGMATATGPESSSTASASSVRIPRPSPAESRGASRTYWLRTSASTGEINAAI